MFGVRIHGRGGQGVVTAAELLPVAAFLDGRHAQAFPSFGSERTGAPVVSFCRIDDRPIRMREPIVAPDALIIHDPTLPDQDIVEALSQLVKTGELAPCEFITVESEFAAMSVSIGASATGARTYTATASQGLLFMVEALYNASGLGLPIVMTVANRAIGAPINIWNDHSDSMSQRHSVIKLDRPGPYRYDIDLDFCKGCGLCAAECPCGAIQMKLETT